MHRTRCAADSPALRLQCWMGFQCWIFFSMPKCRAAAVARGCALPGNGHRFRRRFNGLILSLSHSPLAFGRWGLGLGEQTPLQGCGRGRRKGKRGRERLMEPQQAYGQRFVESVHSKGENPGWQGQASLLCILSSGNWLCRMEDRRSLLTTFFVAFPGRPSCGCRCAGRGALLLVDSLLVHGAE